MPKINRYVDIDIVEREAKKITLTDILLSFIVKKMQKKVKNSA